MVLKLLKNQMTAYKLADICRFFHETWWLFEVFEIPRASSSLILIIFSHTRTQVVL
jgi:hypothetical protein